MCVGGIVQVGMGEWKREADVRRCVKQKPICAGVFVRVCLHAHRIWVIKYIRLPQLTHFLLPLLCSPPPKQLK